MCTVLDIERGNDNKLPEFYDFSYVFRSFFMFYVLEYSTTFSSPPPIIQGILFYSA